MVCGPKGASFVRRGSMATSAENAKRTSIRQYFFGSGPRFAIPVLIIGGIVFVWGSVNRNVFWAIVGAAIVVYGLAWMRRRRPSVRDQEMDSWMEEDIRSHDFAARAKALLKLPEIVRSPIVLRGPAPENLASDLISGERLGDDGKIRTTPDLITVILCSVDQLGIYQTCLDYTTGNRANEFTLEVFYQDVTAVVVSARSKSLDITQAAKHLRSAQISPQQKRLGLSRKKLISNLGRLETKYKEEIVANILQRDLVKQYRIDLSDGERIVIPVTDGRSTRRANNEIDEDIGCEAAEAMFGLREFARDKKLAYLRSEVGLLNLARA